MIFNLYDNDEVLMLNGMLLSRAKAMGSKYLRIGITSGCFDLIHKMHLQFLKRCRRQCDFLIVGVDTDEQVARMKGPERPIIPDWERVEIVESLKPVSAAFVMEDPHELDYLVHMLGVGMIFRNQEFLGRESEVHGSNAAKVVIIPDVLPANSTSDVIKTMLNRHGILQTGAKP